MDQPEKVHQGSPFGRGGQKRHLTMPSLTSPSMGELGYAKDQTIYLPLGFTVCFFLGCHGSVARDMCQPENSVKGVQSHPHRIYTRTMLKSHVHPVQYIDGVCTSMRYLQTTCSVDLVIVLFRVDNTCHRSCDLVTRHTLCCI